MSMFLPFIVSFYPVFLYRYFHGDCTAELSSLVSGLYEFWCNDGWAAGCRHSKVQIATCNRWSYARGFFSRASWALIRFLVFLSARMFGSLNAVSVVILFVSIFFFSYSFTRSNPLHLDDLVDLITNNKLN